MKTLFNFTRGLPSLFRKWLIFFFSGRASVLLLKNDDIGDFLTFLPVAAELRRRYPAEKYFILAVVNPTVRRLAEDSALFDAVLSLPRYRSPWQWRRARLPFLFWNLRRHAVVIDATLAHSLWEHLPGHAPAKGCSIAFHLEEWWNHLSPKLLKQQQLLFQQLIPVKISDNIFSAYEKILKGNGIVSSTLTAENCHDALGTILKKYSNPLAGKKYIAFALGAGQAKRIWPTECYAAVIDQLQQPHSDFRYVLLGTETEHILGEQVASTAQSSGSVDNCCGKYVLGTTLRVISDAQLLIANETSLAHAGAMLRIPTVIIAGGGHWGLFVPYPAGMEGVWVSTVSTNDHTCFGCGWHCTREGNEPVPCIKAVSVNQVLNATEKLLQQRMK